MKCDLRQRQLMVVPVWLIHNMLIILDSIAYIGPSVTTYQQLNPGYRIYEVDGDYVNSSRVKWTLHFLLLFVCVCAIISTTL